MSIFEFIELFLNVFICIFKRNENQKNVIAVNPVGEISDFEKNGEVLKTNQIKQT